MEKDVMTLIERGYKMEAVKMLRLLYSTDLMTAQRIVDEWERNGSPSDIQKKSVFISSNPIH